MDLLIDRQGVSLLKHSYVTDTWDEVFWPIISLCKLQVCKVTFYSCENNMVIKANLCPHKCLKSRHAVMKFAASTGASAQCKLVISRSVWTQSIGINYRSFHICRTFQRGVCVLCVGGWVFQCSSQSIRLLLYCSEWLDTWATARLTSAERELLGEKDQRPPFCLLPSKSRLKNSPSVSSAAQNFKTKREKKASYWNIFGAEYTASE